MRFSLRPPLSSVWDCRGAAAPPSSLACKYRTPECFCIGKYFKFSPTSCSFLSFFLDNIAAIINSCVFVPTSYARIFPPPELEGSGSQWTWISEEDVARARTLDGASDGSRRDNNRPLALARAMSPEGPCVCRTCSDKKKKTFASVHVDCAATLQTLTANGCIELISNKSCVINFNKKEISLGDQIQS